jgi:hypothetical protein
VTLVITSVTNRSQHASMLGDAGDGDATAPPVSTSSSGGASSSSAEAKKSLGVPVGPFS